MDGVLQFGEEPGCVSAIYLCMMELERDCQCCFKEFLAVFSPYQKRIVEDSAIHPHRAVYIVGGKC